MKHCERYLRSKYCLRTNWTWGKEGKKEPRNPPVEHLVCVQPCTVCAWGHMMQPEWAHLWCHSASPPAGHRALWSFHYGSANALLTGTIQTQVKYTRLQTSVYVHRENVCNPQHHHLKQAKGAWDCIDTISVAGFTHKTFNWRDFNE